MYLYAMHLTISLPEEIAQKAKWYVKEKGATFSGFIRKKLEEELKEHAKELDSIVT